MALNGTIVWEVQTGGDDTNGGGYSSDDGGVDYSTQAAAELSLSDLATSGIGVTTLTSVTGGFTAAMVDNIIQIVSGTNVTAGFYRITARTDTNTVTLDRAPDDGGGGISSGVGKVGGALATPGEAAKAANADGQKIWLKSGTYTITTTTPGADGPVEFLAFAVKMEGYLATRGDRAAIPVLDAGAQTSFTMVSTLGGFNDSATVILIKVDGQDNTSVIGFKDTYIQAIKCEALDCDTGFSTSRYVSGCLADGGRFGFTSCYAIGCESKNATTRGFNTCKAWHCLSSGGDQIGFYQNQQAAAFCTAYNTVGDGFVGGLGSDMFDSCLASNCGGYGFNIGIGTILKNCAGYSNTSGNYDSTVAQIVEGFQSLTSDPFVTAGSDFRPNDTAGGGADLRAASTAIDSQSGNWNLDIGAVQHTDPAGGGGGLLTHPGMSGGMRG